MVEGVTRLLETASLVPVAVVGAILNGITLAVFYKRPALRSPSNRFVLSLIGANFVCVGTLTPLAVLVILFDELSPWIQAIAVVAETFAVTTSVFSTLAISIDRYKAVVSPLHYTVNITPERSRCLIALVWLLSAAISAPAFCRRDVCLTENQEIFGVVYSSVLFTVAFVIPLLILVRAYVKMYEAAHRNSERTRRQSLQTSAGGTNSRGGSIDSQYPPVVMSADLIRPGKAPTLAQISKRRCSNTSFSALLFREEGRAVKTAVMVIGNFAFCWGPFFIYLIVDAVVYKISQPCQFLAVLAAIINSVLSPFLYVYRNEIARNEGLRIIFWWKHRSGSLYRGNVLQQACKDIDVKAIEGGIRVMRHQSSSIYDSMSAQSFSLPPPFSPDCKQCAEIPQPPVADFVATYEVLNEEVKPVPEARQSTRGMSVTFKLAMVPQRKCGMCTRQNSDSSSGSGHPLLRDRDTDSPGRRPGTLSSGSSFEDSPSFRGKYCDSPRLPIALEIDETLPHKKLAFQFQVPESGSPESVYASAEGLAERVQNSQNLQNPAIACRDLILENEQTDNSQIMVIPPAPRKKRTIRRQQRLAVMEDEETLEFRTATVPSDFG